MLDFKKVNYMINICNLSSLSSFEDDFIFPDPINLNSYLKYFFYIFYQTKWKFHLQ